MSKTQNKFVARDRTGVLFYDAPGVPTMAGNIQNGKKIEVTAEPSVDGQQRQYTRVIGDKVSGALYPNERKESDKQPDFTGPITIDGAELRLAAWTKQAKTGKNAGADYLSLSISEKRQQSET